jgi:hypothetical protein
MSKESNPRIAKQLGHQGAGWVEIDFLRGADLQGGGPGGSGSDGCATRITSSR